MKNSEGGIQDVGGYEKDKEKRKANVSKLYLNFMYRFCNFILLGGKFNQQSINFIFAISK